jgi:CDP-alcohol phosphatidyltransferase
VLTVRSVPVVGATAQVALLAALEASVGLSGLGWVVGLACGVATSSLVALTLARSGARLGPADLVTFTRAVLTGAVAALTAEAFLGRSVVVPLVLLATAALVSDAVDGRVARRTRTSSFGARFDGEVDALLILVLSAFVARSFGPWVLALGLARYAFAVAVWVLPWMRRELPYRYWRKVVTAAQGIVLTVVAAGVLPLPLAYVGLAIAAALLAESFARDVWWLWRRRDVPVVPVPEQWRWRPAAAALADVAAVALVWFVLVVPHQPFVLSASAFARIPVEGLVVAGLALVLPPRGRLVVAGLAGLLLGLVTVVKVLDLGFFTAFDRPFDPVNDLGYLRPAVDLVDESAGTVAATVAVLVAGLLVLGLLVGMPLAVRRLTRLVARHRTWSGRAVGGLLAVWLVCALAGLENGQGQPVASANASRLAVGQVQAVDAGLKSLEEFEEAASRERITTVKRRDLLGALRGKDVVVAFVESYGRVALEDLAASTAVRAVLDDGTRQLGAYGYSSRSAFLHSPTYGGLSWLAHSTLQSGLWVDDERRYQRLLDSDRDTLSRVFGREGWRTVAVMPSLEERWVEGERFYDFDQVYGRNDIGYVGPRFGWSRVPDQFVLEALWGFELARRDREPVMAKVDLTSSHSPWAPLPRLLDWEELEDGSAYRDILRQGESAAEVWRDPERIRAAYAQSISYSLSTVISFVQTYGDEDLVVVLLGDHEPTAVVGGHGTSHDVPVSVIAKDPAVLEAIDGWGWQAGMRPDGQAPVWPMDAFRDRFLTAYSPLVAERVRPASPPRP